MWLFSRDVGVLFAALVPDKKWELGAVSIQDFIFGGLGKQSGNKGEIAEDPLSSGQVAGDQTGADPLGAFVQVAQNDADIPVADNQTPAILRFDIAVDDTVRLPAGTVLEKVTIDGDDLVLEQPDGSVIVIVNGAVNVPTFLLDGVELPFETIKLAFAESDIIISEGESGAQQASNDSSGGRFSKAPGDIGEGLSITELLPPTALGFDGIGPGEIREQNLKPIIKADSFGLEIRVSEEGLGTGNPDTKGVFDTTNDVVATAKINAIDPNGDPLTFTLSTTAVLNSNGEPIVWSGVGTATLVGLIEATGVEAVTITISPKSRP